MDVPSVHHIECYVRDGERLLRNFFLKFNFILTATRNCSHCKQWVAKSGDAVFVVTQLVEHNQKVTDSPSNALNGRLTDPYVVRDEDACFRTTKNNTKGDIIDSVCNIALKVKNVKNTLERMCKAGVEILKPLSRIEDSQGYVDIAVIKSCVGNVIHTIINTDNYKGKFLPQFVDNVCENPVLNGHNKGLMVTHFDHVTFACTVGSSKHVLQWYEDALGMKRFLMNRDEDEDEGFVIDTSDIGLRLKAMDYWYCAEVGLTTTEPTAFPLKFVIAEALPNQGPNQVDTFLQEHGGPGIQHVGLHTPDIVHAVSSLQQSGICFAEPPYTYYTEVGKLEDIRYIGEDVDVLKANGILVDTEEDYTSEGQSKSKRFLLQKFTKPLFDRNTFFLEVIHRAGAQGFGSGNITALWRSVQAYLEQQKDKQEAENLSS